MKSNNNNGAKTGAKTGANAHPEDCRCMPCQGYTCGCMFCQGGGKHHLLRWLLGIVILILVFLGGFKLGVLTGYLGAQSGDLWGNRHGSFCSPMGKYKMMYGPMTGGMMFEQEVPATRTPVQSQ